MASAPKVTDYLSKNRRQAVRYRIEISNLAKATGKLPVNRFKEYKARKEGKKYGKLLFNY